MICDFQKSVCVHKGMLNCCFDFNLNNFHFLLRQTFSTHTKTRFCFCQFLCMHKYEATRWMECTDCWYSVYDFPLHPQSGFAPDQTCSWISVALPFRVTRVHKGQDEGRAVVGDNSKIIGKKNTVWCIEFRKCKYKCYNYLKKKKIKKPHTLLGQITKLH